MGSDLIERLRVMCIDWDGTDMADEAETISTVTCGTMREAADEITALRERVAALDKANREAVELIDEINKRATSREFWGISQTIHAKLCTVRITLARALLANRGAAVGEPSL